MTRFCAFLAALLLLGACASAPPVPEADPAQQLAAARAQYADEDYDAAAASLRELLASRPPAQLRVEAVFLAGQAAMARKEFAEARNFFTEFSGLSAGNPRIPEAAFMIADSWYRERNRKDRDIAPLREARTGFAAFLRAHPGHALAATASERLADCSAALAAYERGVADLYLARGAWAGAASRLEGVLKDYPGAPDEDRTLFDLVTALTRSGEAGRADAYRRRLLTEYPDSPWAAKALDSGGKAP